MLCVLIAFHPHSICDIKKGLECEGFPSYNLQVVRIII